MTTVKNKFLRIICVLMVAAMLISGLSACGGTVAVTFDYNYDGAPAAEVAEVEKGEVADMPDDPERDLYKFEGWYADKEGENEFDFEEALYDDVTVYAKWKQTHVRVTFNYNYTGAPADKVTRVALKGTATQITENLERDGYYFSGWYTTAACTGDPFDFTTKLENSITLYAAWTEDSGDTWKITYMWNYDGNAGAAYTDRVAKGEKLKSTYKADREGYYLEGWYNDADCSDKFNIKDWITENRTLYANWLKINEFEAEYTDVSNLAGKGYSGDQSGVGCIVNAEKNRLSMNASNNAYIGWMYKSGNTITFVINSDSDVNNAVLALRLSVEFYDATFSKSNFTVKVNGTPLDYPAVIEMTGVPAINDKGSYRPFETYTIDTVSLQQGQNVIELVISNSDNPNPSGSGTMGATAPLIDCLYLYTNANLTWNPIYSNICNQNTD